MNSIRTLQRQLQSSPYAEQNRYLGALDFGAMIGIAGALHLAAILIWTVIPKDKPETIPVRVLNVRLGMDGGTLAANAPITGATTSGSPSEHPIHLGDAPLNVASTADDAKEASAPQPSAQPARETAPKATTSTDTSPVMALDAALSNQARAVKYVRPAAAPGKTANQAMARYGSPLGNSTDINAESLKRYTQLVGLWIAKHRFTPQEAYDRGIQGEGKIYIESDRNGRILRYYVAESTGSTLLDWAMRDAVSRANPLPAVPANYPTENVLRYVIPVSFYRNK